MTDKKLAAMAAQARAEVQQGWVHKKPVQVSKAASGNGAPAKRSNGVAASAAAAAAASSTSAAPSPPSSQKRPAQATSASAKKALLASKPKVTASSTAVQTPNAGVVASAKKPAAATAAKAAAVAAGATSSSSLSSTAASATKPKPGTVAKPAAQTSGKKEAKAPSDTKSKPATSSNGKSNGRPTRLVKVSFSDRGDAKGGGGDDDDDDEDEGDEDFDPEAELDSDTENLLRDSRAASDSDGGEGDEGDEGDDSMEGDGDGEEAQTDASIDSDDEDASKWSELDILLSKYLSKACGYKRGSGRVGVYLRRATRAFLHALLDSIFMARAHAVQQERAERAKNDPQFKQQLEREAILESIDTNDKESISKYGMELFKEKLLLEKRRQEEDTRDTTIVNGVRVSTHVSGADIVACLMVFIKDETDMQPDDMFGKMKGIVYAGKSANSKGMDTDDEYEDEEAEQAEEGHKGEADS